MDGDDLERIGIVAGGGSLPMIVANAAKARGMEPVFALFADGHRNETIMGRKQAFAWGRTGDAIEWLRLEGVRKLVFCGTISSRPDFRSIWPSFQTLRRLPRALAIVKGGDDQLLRNLTGYLEKEGFELLPVQEIAPELLAPGGVLTRRAPIAAEEAALQLAHRAAQALGTLDAGQAVIASNERIIAMEGIEGTRAMLRRVAEYRFAKKIGRGERLALVKAVKPEQDRRFDLPSIGVQTVEEAVIAGISAIGISAGESLILEFDDVLDRANAADLVICGLDTYAREGAVNP